MDQSMLQSLQQLMLPHFYMYYPYPVQPYPLVYYPVTNPPLFPMLSLNQAPQLESTPIKVEQDSSSVGDYSQPKIEGNQPVQNTGQKISRFKYAKKNVQSNVVNQVISFISTKAKSKKVLKRLLETEEKMETFYEIMKQAKRKHVRYVGRAVLQNMIEAEEDHQVYILHRKLKLSKNSLRITEIRKALRYLSNYFLRNLIIPTVLTSSKLDKTTITQHLIRAREIYCFLNNLPPPYPN